MWTYRGKTALITGASSGIGEVFARRLAGRGCNLVLVARSEKKLQALAAEMSERHNIRAEVLVSDLSRDGAAQQVYAETQRRGLSIDIVINNAGFGTHGLFDKLPGQKQHDEVMLNVMAVVDMSHAFLPEMVARGDGAIINVASTAAFQPVPYMAVYGATKAFVLSFSEALWAENRERGVRVMALCPGATETAFFDAMGSQEPAVGAISTSEDVVRVALGALERGRGSVIPGWQQTLLAQVSRFLPRSWVALIAARMFKPQNAETTPASEQAGTSS